MKQIAKLFLFVLIIAFACSKEEIEKPVPLEPYMKSRLTPDTTNFYDGDYYIHISFDKENDSGAEELRLTNKNLHWSFPSESGLGMTVQSIDFYDPESDDNLEISLCYNTAADTSFIIDYADYYFNDPWNTIAGANINYFTPVNDTPDNSQYFMYLGRNSDGGYFKIIYIGENRMNGTFSTRMEECCGGNKVYNVTGDFSVPKLQRSFKSVE